MSAKDHVFTLGIEEEFQIIDPRTRELCSYIQEILANGKMILKEHVKPEMHQSVVELGDQSERELPVQVSNNDGAIPFNKATEEYEW